MKFMTHKRVRFHHCDPAGIVFYPQFFYLMHEAQEDFLSHIGFPLHALIGAGAGVPIVDLKTEFLGMCRNGDELTVTLELTRLGSASIGMHYEIYERPPTLEKPGAIKLRADGIVVHVKVPHGKPAPIPDELRSALLPYLQSLEKHV